MRVPKVATEHGVEDEETVFPVLERVLNIDDKRVVNLQQGELIRLEGAEGVRSDLFKKSALLHVVAHHLRPRSL